MAVSRLKGSTPPPARRDSCTASFLGGGITIARGEKHELDTEEEEGKQRERLNVRVRKETGELQENMTAIDAPGASTSNISAKEQRLTHTGAASPPVNSPAPSLTAAIVHVAPLRLVRWRPCRGRRPEHETRNLGSNPPRAGHVVRALHCQETRTPLPNPPLLYSARGFFSGIDPPALHRSPVGMEIHPASILRF
ncbi:unnamed protein product [Pleuronectes platessa]|uniref:Uncharacterized protein n=1 Tax=Pleuronectes platessa TaxID=8262 RepID=A0A9N7TJD0_PLEPL|nr:unnamed protein product [Pleuronectes platessa]